MRIIPTSGRKTITNIGQGWQTIHCKSDTCVPMIVPGVIVDSPRSDANAASRDRPPIASGDREQHILD